MISYHIISYHIIPHHAISYHISDLAEYYHLGTFLTYFCTLNWGILNAA